MLLQKSPFHNLIKLTVIDTNNDNDQNTQMFVISTLSIINTANLFSGFI